MNQGPPLGAIAAHAARKFADRPCLAYAGQRWSFADVYAIVATLATALVERLSPGARVGLFMSNRPEYIFLQLALERAGLVRVPLNSRFTSHEVVSILEDCNADALFFDSVTTLRASEAALRLSKIWCCQADGGDAVNGAGWGTLCGQDQHSGAARQVSIDDVCSINYTSGTSGKPKGVVLTHRNWAALYRNMLIDRDIRGDDVVGHIGPLTHASGAYVLPWFFRGACNVIVEAGFARRRSSDRLRAVLKKHNS